VVIPVFRAVETLKMIFEQTEVILGDRLLNFVLVYDCGNQESWEKIEILSKEYPKIVGVKLSRNFGQHNATICGFQYAHGDYIITMDEDLQHHPSGIPSMIKEQNKTGADLIYGTYIEKKHETFRNLTSRILNRMLKYGIPELHRDYSSFRLIKSDIAKQTLSMHNSYTFLDGYLSWITTNVSSTKVVHQESQAGGSSYNFRKLFRHFINIFVTFSSLPIRLLTLISFTFFMLSTFYVVYIVVNTLINDNYAAGFPTIISILGFGFGFILLGMGILGEYIQKINLKTTNRPNYYISQIIKKT
jgi:glycosyltransferase involved in cell wall biosynthesis